MDAYKSALAVLPIVFEKTGVPESIVDVGCNDGAWLKAALELGAGGRIFGIDIHDGLKLDMLIDQQDYYQMDLREPITLIGFDLAICLEVAEHLPPESAYTLVKFVTNLAPTVLWSAAVPGQGPYAPGRGPFGDEPDPDGVWHHNEREPEYWEELFHRRGFKKDDSLWGLVKGLDDVDPWYKGTICLYKKEE